MGAYRIAAIPGASKPGLDPRRAASKRSQ